MDLQLATGSRNGRAGPGRDEGRRRLENPSKDCSQPSGAAGTRCQPKHKLGECQCDGIAGRAGDEGCSRAERSQCDSRRGARGILLRDLRMPDFHVHAVNVPSPGAVDGQDTLVLGKFLRDVTRLNQDQRNFRIFGPDETLSNLLGAVFEVTDRQWDAREVRNDEFLAPTGRVLDSMLSEHQCEGWLEGYLLTGRHGLFNSYEAFIRIVDSMFSQHAKWLKVTLELPWRRKIASLNYLLASHVWQQDHNGFTHQDPGFLDHVVNKKADIVRV